VTPPRRALGALLLSLPLLAAAERPTGGGHRPDARALAARVEGLVRSGAASLSRVQDDPDFPGRRHLRFDRRVGGVRVFGAQLVQQLDADGTTLSVSGSLEEGPSVDVAPALTADRAAREAEGAFPRGAVALGEPELVVLPREQGAVLAWTLWVRLDHRLDRVFVDARAGGVVHRYSDLRTEAAVGLGSGVWGDRKKVSADSGPGGFRAEDRLRPSAIATWDLGFDVAAAGEALTTGRLPPGLVAADADNDWTDGAIVDAHAYAGWTYDYYYGRHGRRGLDGRDLPVRSVTHFLPRSYGFANAFWDPVSSAAYYGDGDGAYAPFSGALDVVAHELTHAVTQHTWDGVYEGESGALVEAFSDAMATGAEFFHQPAGPGRRQADYFLGEDLPFAFDPPRTATRSMENPALFCSAALGQCDPDHYSRRYRGELDNGGVHHNCAIASQAFYLMAEGGANRTSGRRVAGLGASGREKAERVFYRGFTLYLTPSATFRDARAATVRAARDLLGEAEAAQVASAWSAVGVE
jgi:Zn-dependent metalloprotease